MNSLIKKRDQMKEQLRDYSFAQLLEHLINVAMKIEMRNMDDMEKAVTKEMNDAGG